MNPAPIVLLNPGDVVVVVDRESPLLGKVGTVMAQSCGGRVRVSLWGLGPSYFKDGQLAAEKVKVIDSRSWKPYGSGSSSAS